jgi:Protein of unknown function (DUF2844)
LFSKNFKDPAYPSGNPRPQLANLNISSACKYGFPSRGSFGQGGPSVKNRQVLQISGSYRKSALWSAILAAAVLVIDSPALAGLGEDVSSVQADQAKMLGSLRTTQAQAFEVHEIKAATGVVVREYVSGGKVFAVAWQGPWPPDMRQILAGYFDQYQRTAQAEVNSRAGRRPLAIEEPGLVVQSGGHMRSFAGRAYVPQMLPPGVSAEAIQ